ncbi:MULTISPECIES: DUF4214 domain-containing protein [Stenotrophomonas]|nr:MULTISPECIES: DUF4214 domain-containing protein [Stenotrophomonas]MBS4801897.1 DUF4214 domain-containing protein [Stenotrophomonas maltophilia]MDG9988534.1 DUF4214 domain-containing protein [Stenotrophomonas sp. GD04024]HEL4297150.1 DUF4214 domain-containing protein [Stenotrophomonas maltophilia]
MSNPSVSIDPAAFPRQLNIGCGFDKRADFLNVDLNDFHAPDLVSDASRLPMLPSQYYVHILANDVLEHIPRAKCLSTLKEWNRLLGVGGTLHIQIPNIVGACALISSNDARDPAYHDSIVACLFGTQGYTGDYHFNSFTPESARWWLSRAGFDVVALSERDTWLLEIDAIKTFHVEPEYWIEDGDDNAFVTAMYEKLLARAPDPAGLEYFLGRLSNGCERETAIAIMRQSNEAEALHAQINGDRL